MKKALDKCMPIVYTYSMKRISMFLTESQIERLSSLAKATGLKMSELTRRAIDEFLKRQKEGK
jgi:predicted transcriptional regulator